MKRWTIGVLLLIPLAVTAWAQSGGTSELLYVMNARSDFVSVIGIPDNKVVGQIRVGRGGSGIAATRDGTRLYVAVESGPKVLAIDTRTSQILWSVPVGDTPHHIALSGDGRYLYVCIFSSNHLDIVDTETRTVIGKVRVGFQPHNVYTSRDGKKIYSGQIGQDNISVVDVRVEKSVKLGSQVRVRLFRDVFNILNAYAAETITVSTGTSYLQPTAILAPRTGRIGA